MTGLLILVLALAAATAFGLYRRRVDGRFAASSAPAVVAGTVDDAQLPVSEAPAGPDTDSVWSQVESALPGVEPGRSATLVQFSSAFCAPCRTTRVVLADVAEKIDGVVHVEVDAEQHLDLVRALDVRRTPTTLVLDARGVEITRAAGAPRREQVLAALPAL